MILPDPALLEQDWILKSPFPYFGGKSRVAGIVWQRFGDVPNYVEPFFGSGAVLLARPHPKPGTETVNDLDAYLVNLWRSLKWDPEETAAWADWPVNETDLLARHKWLIETGKERIERLKNDPAFFDPQVAGWWVWGQCAWIGSGWCEDRESSGRKVPEQLPAMQPMGINRKVTEKMPCMNSGRRINRRVPEQIPHLLGGRGLNRKLPAVGDAGKGINRKLPHLGNGGLGLNRTSIEESRENYIFEYFNKLSARLRDVRVCQGSWDRVMGESVTCKHGMTGVFLDPPYSETEHSIKYSAHSDVAADVRTWAIANGDNPLLRIALCGYEGEHKMPSTWEVVEWKAVGGYGSQGEKRGRDNATRERIWFSPACLKIDRPQTMNLFDPVEEGPDAL